MTAVCAERVIPHRDNPLRHLAAMKETVVKSPIMDLYCRLCGLNSSSSGNNITHHIHGSSHIAPKPMMRSQPSPHHAPSIESSQYGISPGGGATTPQVSLGKSPGGTPFPVCRPKASWCQWRWGQSLWTVVFVSFLYVLLLNQPLVAEAHPAPAAQQYGGGGHYGNNNHNNGNRGHSMRDEEYDEPEVFRLRGRPVTDTAYLTTFGYLPQSDFETGAMRTQEEMSRAIRRFQQFANLPLSGTFDEKTRTQMAKPRCGLPDIIPTKRDTPSRRSRANPEMEVAGGSGRHRLRHQRGHHRGGRVKRYELSDAKWETTRLTYRILNHSPDMQQTDVRRAIYRALKLWSDVTHLTFREKIAGDADIMIRFAAGYHGDGYSFDGHGLILAHAFFPGPDRGGDVHFDEDEYWTADTDDGTNLFIVAAHEIGHALGLSHSPVPGSLMFPWYQGYQPNYRLPQDDIDGIQAFYGVRTPPVYSTVQPGPGGGGGSKPSLPPPAPTTTFQPVTRKAWTTTTPLPTPPTGNQAPDSCNAVIDAISIVRGEIFAFSGKWFWRVDGNGVMKDYPVEINRFWYGFPKDVDRIDAVYEEFGGKIVFFRGARYWSFNGNHMLPNFPKTGRPLTDIGLPADLTHVDAAFQWGYNKMVYIISGFNYWRYNTHEEKVEADYPRDMSMWKGVPLPVGAAFQFWDGRTYFFQGTQTWCFNDARMAVRESWPKHTGETFLDCKRQMKQGFEADNPDMVTGTAGNVPRSHLLVTAASLLFVLVLAS